MPNIMPIAIHSTIIIIQMIQGIRFFFNCPSLRLLLPIPCNIRPMLIM